MKVVQSSANHQISSWSTAANQFTVPSVHVTCFSDPQRINKLNCSHRNTPDTQPQSSLITAVSLQILATELLLHSYLGGGNYSKPVIFFKCEVTLADISGR